MSQRSSRRPSGNSNFWQFVALLIVAFGVFRGCQKQNETPQRQATRTPSPQRTNKPRAGRTPQRSPQRNPQGGTALTLLPPGADNNNWLPGMPAKAGQSPDNFLVERPQYALSYSRGDGGPNWVSWHLDAATLGPVQRGDFRPDPDLPPDWQIRPTDYRGSGYDRGHVCPSGDRTFSEEDNNATFYMSNMLPQTAALNQHVWKSLEDECRDLVGQGNELYIVAGPLGSTKRIGRGKVNVPAQCWKIALVLPAGDNDLSRLDARTRVIAVLMPNEENEQVENAKWTQYATSVAQIEKATGYNFFPNLPANVRRSLKSRIGG